MINEILLSGDNIEVLTKIAHLLSDYKSIQQFKFTVVEQMDHNSLQANQSLIYIGRDEEGIIEIYNKIQPVKTSYITSSPHLTLISKNENIEFIGNQRHLSTNNDRTSNFNLGAIKDNISITEPAIRESELFLLDLNVLRSSEVHPATFSYPSGLFTEDISQMCRYAGMTEKNKYFFINHAVLELSTLVAQLIWYFAEAASGRFPDHPYFTNTVEEYAVQVTSFDTMLSFFKSKSSGRWWVKVPNIEENKWKSCNYEDYQEACKDNISPELLEIISNVE